MKKNMTRFKTQAEVCKYFGKKEDDRKFVSRSIAKGIVVKEGGGYRIVEDKTNSEKPKIAENSGKKAEGSVSELEEARVNCEYWHNMFKKMKRGYELVIDMTYQYAVKNTKISKTEYKEQLSEAVREQLDKEFKEK